MLLSKELEGKNVVIKMATFATTNDNEYNGIVKKIIYYGDIIMIKLDTGKLINTNYISVIEIVD